MRQYNIYDHPFRRVEAVKQGWSWPAFFFSWLWAAIKGLWGILFGFILLQILLLVIWDALEIPAINLFDIFIQVALSFVFGLKGNAWREEKFLSRGYLYADTITAANSTGSIALYINKNRKQANNRDEPHD
ncbi:DUF2628 domain-containing protein [Methylococcus sp. Mc7]|uniref:DUF2628 domain-containing protein n=1 Tax=Methylococcus sp. Mc7 TaxID=2860258 RepID=UPI001C52C37A|nr:DUF2628 domain-containing protein [Methylococcus sp. Mc7]QXP85791.1 DUF2628 domain-containing protein [Methylococcus sp. Mc7]